MSDAEERLRGLGRPKIDLQIRQDNVEAIAFYERLGYEDDPVTSFGKRLEHDEV